MPGPIRVMLSRISKSKGFVKLIGPDGESKEHKFKLPWLDDTEWQAVFLSLELFEEDSNTWPTKPEVLKKARELHLFEADPSEKRFEIIGRTLYDRVFGSEAIRSLLDRLLHTEGEIPVVEFHIQDEGSILQAYPWELSHDEEGFLFNRKRAFPVRHVDFEEPITQFELTGALSVLYIAPRPIAYYGSLPVLEKSYLEDLNERYSDRFALKSQPANTLDTLHKHLIRSKSPVHIVHIDTHGGFGWLCRCKQLNPPGMSHCSKCNSPRPGGQRDRGYLAFETASGDVRWVSGDDLSKLLHRRGIQMAVLSACRSGLVGGKSTFNSVAGALIKQHIPAVVAMQFSIKVEQAKQFVEFFYEALANERSLTEAVAEARLSMSTDSWYRPVLYLRTDQHNYRGMIFQAAPKKVIPPLELIAEWKRIHQGCQKLLSEIDIPLKDLQEYSRTGDKSRLRTASEAWATRCSSLLEDTLDRWELNYVQIPELNNLQKQIENVKELHNHLMRIKQINAEFWNLYNQVGTLHGILWRLLDTADRNISKLLETVGA